MKLLKRRLIVVLLITLSFTGYSQNWESLGNGLDYGGLCLFADSNNLYVGKFWQNPKNNTFAVWNGLQWDSLGDGPYGPVWSIVKFQGDLYSGGAGGVYRWDGSNWLAPGGGVNGAVTQLYPFDTVLYAVGTFDTAGMVPADQIAKWDGVTWSAVDTTVWFFGLVSNIISYKGDLYIGGNMINRDGSIVRIAHWDGSMWKPVGNGISGSMGGIFCFEIYDGLLYAGGLFRKQDNNPGDGIARWDGSSWSDVGGGFPQWPSTVEYLKVINNELYAVGAFSNAGGIPVNNIAKWNGVEWCGLGSQFDNRIMAVEEFKGEIHIAGGFWTIDGDSILRIAKWTGGNYVDTCGSISSYTDNLTNYRSVELFPNPSSGTVYLQSNLTNKSTKLILHISDLVGRELLQVEMKSTKTSINVSNLQSGLYLYTIKGVGGVFGKGKLVIQ